MLTLEECIEYFETEAETSDSLMMPYEPRKKYSDDCKQMADWLRELKAYRKAEKEIEQELVNWNDIDNGKCRGLFLATSIIQHYKNEEVKADESVNSL